MITNREVLEEMVVAKSKVLSRQLPGGTEEEHKYLIQNMSFGVLMVGTEYYCYNVWKVSN